MYVKLLILFITGFSFSAFSQVVVSGKVVEKGSSVEIPFANIGIKLKNVGTASMEDGTFLIQIPETNKNDTLTFSAIGFEELNLPVHSIAASEKKLFELSKKTTILNPVTITSGKLVEKPFGIKNSSSLIHFTDGSTNQDDIFEIAQVIKMDAVPSRITSLNLLVNGSSRDSGVFRINFYDFRDNRPGERIVQKHIIQEKKIEEGWLKFDLTGYDIYLKDTFVVALEFIPQRKKIGPIYYEVKLGGSAKSFVRSSSHGAWSVPPHHYRLYLTAMVEADKHKSKRLNDEEKESVPEMTLYSSFVRDTFAIFVSLPKDYHSQTNQHYDVMYLLDANAYFDIVADAARETKRNCIIVGIGYNNVMLMDSLRNRDYLFPGDDKLSMSGGAGNFLNFIEKELLPHINKQYRTHTTNQTLMGHSFGGYFTLYTLHESLQGRSAAFTNYVAASPSLEYAGKYLINKFLETEPLNFHDKKLFISYGELEDIEDGGKNTAVRDSFNEFVNVLNDDKYKRIELKSEVLPGYGHIETAVPSFTRSLKELK